MGQIRTKDIKDLARDLHEVYPDRFSTDFENNKAVMGELKITEGKSKIFRNRVAGYIVRLACQVEHGRHPPGERAAEPVEQSEQERELVASEANAAEETEAEAAEDANEQSEQASEGAASEASAAEKANEETSAPEQKSE